MNFTSRELRLIREMERRLIGVRTFADIYKAIEDVMLLVCKAEHLAVGFSHVDNSPGLEWEAPTVKPLLQGYSAWAPRCFVYQYTLSRPNRAARDGVMLQGVPLERTETFEHSVRAGLKLRRVLATLLFKTRAKFLGGLAMYKESAREFSLRDELLLQSFIPAIKEAVDTVQDFQAERFRGDLLSALSREPWAGMVLNALGRRVEETGTARDVVNDWYPTPRELSHDVPADWVTFVKWLSSLDGVPPPDQRTLTKPRGLDTLKVSFKPSTVLRPGCTLYEVRIVEELHWMREEWSRKLSPQQLKVADLLNEGARDEDIARELKLALNTVKEHTKEIYRRTDTEGRLDFVTRGRRS
ncbi:helix-turn-helix domain-containing protein [Corallococcus aberystwythensis]|uniref:LuxR family transcriptional regulator n=1 Tax=Corallococcus aberystwythensis TaxID=2316722 RepID=A0A3A8PIS1_9BACT|nr:helix-turn-helix transcriptional regulator [Corallococcus aberystwythensis]RKH55210.1 LuxR family transcriptional regulator [Corallococcus aberystwythensis]